MGCTIFVPDQPRTASCLADGLEHPLPGQPRCLHMQPQQPPGAMMHVYRDPDGKEKQGSKAQKKQYPKHAFTAFHRLQRARVGRKTCELARMLDENAERRYNKWYS